MAGDEQPRLLLPPMGTDNKRDVAFTVNWLVKEVNRLRAKVAELEAAQPPSRD